MGCGDGGRVDERRRQVVGSGFVVGGVLACLVGWSSWVGYGKIGPVG